MPFMTVKAEPVDTDKIPYIIFSGGILEFVIIVRLLNEITFTGWTYSSKLVCDTLGGY